MHSSAAQLRAALTIERAGGRSIGFVPTMGALHAGHLALVEAAIRSHEVVVVSIFVNPAQFGPNEDYSRYPRMLEADSQLLASLGAPNLHIYAPPVEDVYGGGRHISLTAGPMGQVLCGRSRPGHFDGVLLVVAKLLHIVGPDAAYFGRKDYQQSILVRALVRELMFPVEIIACPIVREADGLAMSSRNAYLTPEERRVAPALHNALLAMRDAAIAGETSVAALRAVGLASLPPAIRLDYLEIVHPDTLEALSVLDDGQAVAAIAGYLGATRLIDNMDLH